MQTCPLPKKFLPDGFCTASAKTMCSLKRISMAKDFLKPGDLPIETLGGVLLNTTCPIIDPLSFHE